MNSLRWSRLHSLHAMFHLAPAHGKSKGILNGVGAFNAIQPFKMGRQFVRSSKQTGVRNGMLGGALVAVGVVSAGTVVNPLGYGR